MVRVTKRMCLFPKLLLFLGPNDYLNFVFVKENLPVYLSYYISFQNLTEPKRSINMGGNGAPAIESDTVMNAGAEESRIVDSEMFVRSDGVPMAFMMPPQGMERQQVREIILISSQIVFLILYFVDQTVY